LQDKYGAFLRQCFLECRIVVNPLTPELDPSKQRCLPEFFPGDFKF